MMSETQRCGEVRDLIPELAMGVAPGDERAAALAHVARCLGCRRLLEETAATVDELMLLAPEREPPAGFEARFIEALDGNGPTRRKHVTALLAAAAVLVVAGGAAGLTRWADADDRKLAAQYRETLAVADGSYLRAADLMGENGLEAGHVFAYQGQPSWVFVSVENAPSGDHQVRLVTEDGRVHTLGRCRVRDGRGSWGTAVDVPIHAVDRVELVRGGRTLAAAFG
jgi:hypothetical protein